MEHDFQDFVLELSASLFDSVACDLEFFLWLFGPLRPIDTILALRMDDIKDNLLQPKKIKILIDRLKEEYLLGEVVLEMLPIEALYKKLWND